MLNVAGFICEGSYQGFRDFRTTQLTESLGRCDPDEIVAVLEGNEKGRNGTGITDTSHYGGGPALYLLVPALQETGQFFDGRSSNLDKPVSRLFLS